MKHSLTQSGINSAECRLVQSRRASRESFAQMRSAIRSRLAQPSSLLVTTGLGALLGVWFARRHRPRVKQDAVSVRAPIVGLVSTLLLRFGLQRLADTWMRLRDPDSSKG
jgi:lipopolysaccharide export LptBFGC system permease protein LptF